MREQARAPAERRKHRPVPALPGAQRGQAQVHAQVHAGMDEPAHPGAGASPGEALGIDGQPAVRGQGSGGGGIGWHGRTVSRGAARGLRRATGRLPGGVECAGVAWTYALPPPPRLVRCRGFTFLRMPAGKTPC
ncbi:hypothetical protein Aave_2037 [Paracidovorax citrulli AAC00-1]|uniref:Uncharacterized protein n=1 Tax=Paracidovorax citrulli (strain AAC00-1) TaxID=397945 RepID=A1TNT2_PARC0|nr:hypothetical protein Aave_2037 [Paracidovorax citrulli AAC00-1]